MSLKNTPKPPSSPSITIRLTVLYLISTLVLLACIIGFLLRNMIADLEYEDSDFLHERIASIQSMISRRPENLNTVREQILTSATNKHMRYLVRIQDESGKTLLESPGMSVVPSLHFPAPVINTHKPGKALKQLGTDSRHYLLNAAWAEGNGDRHFRLVQVALDVTEEMLLMTKYRTKMTIALLAGLCLAGGLGMLISRKGLQPVQDLATLVKQITATDLHQRVDRKPWPKELKPLTGALDTMLGQLESSFARLTEFSANLAHELRTPINNLRVEAEVALSRPRSAEEYRHTIESNTEEYEHLSRMISDILFLARPEQGITPKQLDLRAELETLIDYYQTLAEERQISLTISGNGNVTADPRLFQRAAGNLLANALYYTQPGGQVTVTITQRQNGYTSVAIQDNGEGIPEHEIPLVFDRFYRSAQARQQRHEGSGLGLAIVRSIMELHGGSVTLDSVEGQGATATLIFPPSIGET